ncbi:MAG: type VI secretion system tip protein TssI/VgrG [Pigmentiphaga sp.]|uniref:type VI secretion system Vgr family protein n=1 Tax=Pigmentiphaga sp. TaxID=1977564 RepID=UPI0029BD9A77|nr:type VI secretion system tip protein TssI/VgrG [Pigmentiphaga sp.]MDX3905806.1 type VI secretion system tip protein TssI/VgrG [Pigmentiphaga sp.]
MNRTIQAHTPLGPLLAFRSMYGSEGLSRLFEFEVDLVASTHSLDMKQLLGKPLTLEIQTDWLSSRFLSGHVVRCALVGRDGGTSRNYIYRASVRPWLWYLTQTSDNKIFQTKTVPEILDEVLGEYGFPVEKKLTGSYRPWNYCVQYQETDFAFVNRLMEHEGIYYYFKHEQGQHTLVLADDLSAHEAAPGYESVPYYGPDRVAVPQEEYIDRWVVAEEITPGGFATVDFDFRKPRAGLDSQRSNPGTYDYADMEVYDWLGGYTEPEQAEFYSRIRLEELQSRHERVAAHTNARGLAPGYRFELRNHPRASENREYLVVDMNYQLREGGYASGDDGPGLFDVDLGVQPTGIPFRPPRATAKPRTHGPQTAVVVGPEGEEIWTDEYGRVKVQFHWDRYGRRDQNSSCWIRVSSSWASANYGAIFLPRIGDEVLVDFIGGEPDRPIIIGRVYNADRMPPWPLPGAATQSGVLTRSSKGGSPANANALRFEDKKGAEQVWLHAERNLDTEVEADETRTVGGNRTTAITGNEKLDVTGTRTTNVTGLETATYNGGEHRLVNAGAVETINGGQTRTVNGGVTETVTGGENRNVTGGVSETIAGGETRVIAGGVTENITGGESRTIVGGATWAITGALTATVNGQEILTTTGGRTETVNAFHTSTVNGPVTKTTTGPITVTAPAVTVNAPGWQVNTASESFWTAKRASGTGLRFSIIGASLDLWGARQQIYVVNSQAALVKLEFSLFQNKNSTLKMVNNVVEARRAAARVSNSGLDLRANGLTVES